jgi:hypothetical protein
MKANVITTLEYARVLAGTITAAEFVELSSAQPRKQCELILKQAGALKSLAQTMTKSSADKRPATLPADATAEFGQLFGRPAETGAPTKTTPSA